MATAAKETAAAAATNGACTTSSSDSAWSSVYRDALLSIFSFIDLKGMHSVRATCDIWRLQASDERCRETELYLGSAEAYPKFLASLQAVSKSPHPEQAILRHV